MTTIAKQVKGDTKKIAQQIAKQIAQEPLEILKTAVKQTTDLEYGEKPKENQPEVNSQNNPEEKKAVDEQKLHNQSIRLMQALEKELEDIQEQEKVKQLQAQQAEQIQEEQKAEEKKSIFQTIMPQGKKRRNMLGMPGKKGPSQPTGTTKTEVRKPPSG